MADLSDFTYALGGYESPSEEASHRTLRHVRHRGEKVGSVATRPIVVDVRHLDWQLDAACQGADPEMFFPEGPVSQTTLTVCRHCPVFEKCLNHALDNPTLRGIWAGTTDAQRRRIRKRRRQQTAAS